MICDRIATSIHLIDPATLHAVELTSTVYWRAPFPALCSTNTLTEYVVLDVELLGPTRGKVVCIHAV